MSVVLCSKQPISHTTPMCNQHRSRSLQEVMHAKCNCWHAGIFSVFKEECCAKGCFKRPVSFSAAISLNWIRSSGWRRIYSILYTIASAKKLDIYHLSSLLNKSFLSLSLRHLCPSAVAIVLQWEAAVAVQAGHDERLFLFSFFSSSLLNYNPPRPLVASQGTPQRTSSPSKPWTSRPSLPKLSAVIEVHSIASWALDVCRVMENLDYDKNDSCQSTQSMTR